jgi:polysaccharide export outer membrane protein
MGHSLLKRITTILMIVCLLSACVSMTTDDTIEATPEVVQTLNRYTREYSIFPGDVLEIAMYRNENLARVVIVREDGRISLPMLDEIHVEGMTVTELD